MFGNDWTPNHKLMFWAMLFSFVVLMQLVGNM